jgi:hypothetical protein
VFVSVGEFAELGHIFSGEGEEEVDKVGDISKIMSGDLGSLGELRGEELGLRRMGISIGVEGLQRRWWGMRSGLLEFSVIKRGYMNILTRGAIGMD